ncbi:MAG: pyruvate kinase [Deltaproteobacteria bacterium]|nr:MAG: pyruvate kinase [Deltaproteobacteria bacterium]
MGLPPKKTKIVATLGPASASPQVVEGLIRAGASIFRLNFSHGDFEFHGKLIETVTAVSRKLGERVTLMADLPGPKIRLGILPSPLFLTRGEVVELVEGEKANKENTIPVSLPRFSRSVRAGDPIFISDGTVCLRVEEVRDDAVICRVEVGGEIASRKGVNLPQSELALPVFTGRDRECLAFALSRGVHAVSQSFVEKGEDVDFLRREAEKMGKSPFVIAKIERARALANLKEIVQAADGIMVARGDLGVEVPIEEIAVLQKEIISLALAEGKPVITATQMLESMTDHTRPTRAEATDVANAILDGTDCVMLSAESATGAYPVESVEMLARIAAFTEKHRKWMRIPEEEEGREETESPVQVIARSVAQAIKHLKPAFIVVPTRSGHTARQIARFRPDVWIFAVSPLEKTCQDLLFTAGVIPLHVREHPADWTAFVRSLTEKFGLEGEYALLTEGPSPEHPEMNHRMEVIPLR